MPRKTFGLKHPPLTKEQILAMDAGWRLDQAVAILDMGWQACSIQPPRSMSAEEPLDLIPYMQDDHVSNIRPTPAYSKSDALALDVIDRVGCNCTWRIGLSSEGCSVAVGGLSVLLCHDVPEIKLESDRRADFAKLVCQAALLSDCIQGACVPTAKTN